MFGVQKDLKDTFKRIIKMAKELTDKELILIMNKYGYNFDIKSDTVDSSHHTYVRKKRLRDSHEFEVDDEMDRAFEQFKKDLELDED